MKKKPILNLYTYIFLATNWKVSTSFAFSLMNYMCMYQVNVVSWNYQLHLILHVCTVSKNTCAYKKQNWMIIAISPIFKNLTTEK